MSIDIIETPTIEFIATPVSLRSDQREWLDAEALRQMHRNRSRVVQEAVDLYRRVRTGQVTIDDKAQQNGGVS